VPVLSQFQSEVEETIERIKVQSGVEGYVICNKQGQVLRRFPTMSLEDAERYATTMISLTTQARGVVRDLDPKVIYHLKYSCCSIGMVLCINLEV